jgi:hypothetical protein
LASANKTELARYELIGGGTGIYWPSLDEDLSLKGFLRDELKGMLKNRHVFAA